MMRIYNCIPNYFTSNSRAFNLLKGKCEFITSNKRKRPDKVELKRLVEEYDAIIIGAREEIGKEVLENSRLKFIGILAGKEKVDLNECKKKGIIVFDIIGSNAISVAEHILLLILALAKNLLNLDRSVREKKFDKLRNSGQDLYGKTIGIIGAGSITVEVIKRIKGLGMNILCWTINPERHRDLKVKFIGLDELLKASDYISIQIRLSKRTEKLIGERELRLIKPTAFLINTSRGGLIDENELIKALKNKKLAGAALDVFEKEPTYNKELFKLDNVVLTPHSAGITKDAKNKMEEKLAKDVVKFIDS